MDEDCMLPRAVFGVIAALLIIALACFIMSDAPRDETPVQSSSVLELNTSNAAQMHNHGLPTKADVMEWHLHGQWGYYQDGMLYAFADLPGRDEVWDELYGIDPNPNFDK